MNRPLAPAASTGRLDDQVPGPVSPLCCESCGQFAELHPVIFTGNRRDAEGRGAGGAVSVVVEIFAVCGGCLPIDVTPSPKTAPTGE